LGTFQQPVKSMVADSSPSFSHPCFVEKNEKTLSNSFHLLTIGKLTCFYRSRLPAGIFLSQFFFPTWSWSCAPRRRPRRRSRSYGRPCGVGRFFYFYIFYFRFLQKYIFDLEIYSNIPRPPGNGAAGAFLKKFRGENCAQVPGGRSPATGRPAPRPPGSGVAGSPTLI